MPGLLDGKVALITGAGSGIGEAIAVAMAEAGARVVAVDINTAVVERVAGKLAGNAVGLALDVRDRVACDGLAAKVKAEIGPIAVLVSEGVPTKIAPSTRIASATMKLATGPAAMIASRRQGDLLWKLSSPPDGCSR